MNDKQRHIVVFDLGGVLIDWNPRHLYRKLIDDPVAMEEFLATVCTPAWNEQQDAGRPFAEAVALLCRRFPRKSALITAYFERWGEMLGGAHDGSVEILRRLKSAGLPLYAVTNWSAETFPIAQARFDFLDWFDGIVVSGEVGVIKPDHRIFEILCERHSFQADEAVFIDDSAKNIAAAREFGMHAIKFTDSASLARDLIDLGYA